MEGEKEIRSGPANLHRGMENVGGKLTLTNERLVFVPHGFNFQRAPAEILLSHITQCAVLRLRCHDPWTLKTKEFQSFSKDLLQHIIATESEKALFLQPYYRDTEKTVGSELIRVSKVLGVVVQVVESRRFSVAET